MGEEKTNKAAMPHNLILQNRQTLTISGVVEIGSFDKSSIVLYTDLGELTILGSDLHMNQLSVESGDVAIEGHIRSMA